MLARVEFSDYQCPFCGRHARETFPAIRRDYIDTGKLKYVFRDSPIESIHPNAFKAVEAAHCAGEQGKYGRCTIVCSRISGLSGAPSRRSTPECSA